MTLLQRLNQARLDHASSSLPKKKKRGKAIPPPGLSDGESRCEEERTVADCIALAEGQVQVVTLDVLVYLPLPPLKIRKVSKQTAVVFRFADSISRCQKYNIPHQLYHYYRNQDALRAILKNLSLYFEFPNLPITTPLVDVLSNVVGQIRSRYGSDILPLSAIPLPLHARLPIHLLAFTNLGRANGSHQTPRLTTAALPNGERTTVYDILNDGRNFAIDRFAVTAEKHFQLNTGMYSWLVNVESLWLTFHTYSDCFTSLPCSNQPDRLPPWIRQ